jgi:DNA-binding CsgD family transcriptional regulator
VPGAGRKLEEALFGATTSDERPLEPLRIFEAAHRALLGLEGTVLLCVDDLQWVDVLSLALCSYLVRSADAEGKGVAAIAATRPAGAGAAWPGSILGPDRITSLELGPLERDEGVRLVSQLAPQVNRERAAELWTLAEGSPFWLGILARSGGERDLADYLLARERGLTRDSSRLLALLAVAARPLAPPELDALLTWDETRTEQAVAELERSGLVVVEANSVRIGHDLIRSSAVAQLPPLQRRELHGLFASWLEQQAGDDVRLLLEALVHRQEAGLEVSKLALRVLQSPRRRLLGADGLRNLSRIADQRGFSEPLDVALYERIATLASELAEHPTAMERWTELAANVSDPSLKARCFLEASRAASRIVQRRDEALSLLARARSLAPSDPVLAVEIEADHANLIRSIAHRMEDGRQVAEQAAVAARRLWASRDPTQLSSQERNAYVAALQAAFDSAVIEEDPSDLLRISEEMTDVARGSEEATVAAALNMSRAMWFFGRAAEALDYARRAWLQSHDRVLRGFVLEAGSVFASRLIETGALGEADEVVSECIELERRIGGGAERLAPGRVAVRRIHDVRHQVWLSRGDWRDAIASLEREVMLQPDPHYRVQLRGMLVLWLARCGGGARSADVAQHVAAGRTDAAAAGCRRCARELSLRLAEALARLGRLQEAGEELQRWDEGGRPAELSDKLWRRHAGALAAIPGPDPASAIRELEAVMAERSRLGMVFGLLWARLDLAGALARIDATRAASEYRQAGIEANTAGAATEEQLAELGLRRLGVRTWRRGRASRGESALDRLSERERQIATLIAAGNSNPEIANTLFLSRKTIERHVSNILARTNTRNRTDLARLVSQTEPVAEAVEK